MCSSLAANIGRLLAALLLVEGASSTRAAPSLGRREEFRTPGNGGNLGVWRITHDPTTRHWANYHNTRCFSPDGRYLCYTRYAEGKTEVEVFVYDARLDVARRLAQGDSPRWAHGRNWLFFRTFRGGAAAESEIHWYDADADTKRLLAKADGELELGEPDADDRWLMGGRLSRLGGRKTRSGLRVRIGDKAEVQDLSEVRGYQFMTNPRHPLFFTRWRQDPGDFSASRLWYDLDGKNERIGIPLLQNAHTSWLGNGEYHLMGNGLARGRRWNEPFPSNVHILAGVQMGDISPCGASGRYVTGDHWIADLRSGDGWHFINPLSVICFPAEVGDASTTYDADPKGSPDGTKVAFVSNYDLKEGPLTFLTAEIPAEGGALQVRSTAGFPARGSVVIRSEVIGYARTTPTSFEGITRARFATARAPARTGQAVTSFEARLLNDEQWRRLGRPAPEMRSLIRDPDSPLMRQRQTDVYVAVVRRPDRPVLRQRGETVELIPGEEHREIFGFHVLHADRRLTTEPMPPGATIALEARGEYRAIAVERSGLESEPGPALRLKHATTLRVLRDPPADFAWTIDRWLVGERAATAETARQAPAAVCEIVHRCDGVIAREWHESGALQRHHDLTREGKPSRVLEYRDGRLATRAYVDPAGRPISREVFDRSGFITETITCDSVSGGERDHWWFERGLPVRQVKDGREFRRAGDAWVALKGDEEGSGGRKKRKAK